MSAILWICYTAVHTDTGLTYVGVTARSLDRRRQDHKDAAKTRKGRFPTAIREHGVDAFTWNVVAEGTEDVMRLLERILIYEWDTANPDYGYNEKGGCHPAQIRYQLKKESWKHYGPPWNKPIPDDERDHLEFGKMMDDKVAILDTLNNIDSWINRNIEDESVGCAVAQWQKRIGDRDRQNQDSQPTQDGQTTNKRK